MLSNERGYFFESLNGATDAFSADPPSHVKDPLGAGYVRLYIAPQHFKPLADALTRRPGTQPSESIDPSSITPNAARNLLFEELHKICPDISVSPPRGEPDPLKAGYAVIYIAPENVGRLALAFRHGARAPLPAVG